MLVRLIFAIRKVHPLPKDITFEEEQAHLSATYAKLLQMQQAIQEKIATTDEKAARDKESMADDLSLNMAAYDDAMEMYAAFAAVNREIDSYNISQESSARKLSDIRVLLEEPYFAKVVLGYGAGKDDKELYIGTVGMTDDDYARMVVDWRSPVAEVYYNQANGPTSYEANGRKIDVDLKLRRQFSIRRDQLNAYFDTTVAIEDPLLLASLSKERSSHMKAITATIQKEQNAVVRHEDVPTLIVSGIAGSGKTSVLLQRIAYLFYRQRDTLAPHQVVLMTPNPLFARYIANVLPEMGETNPQTITWDEFATRHAGRDRAHGKLEADISQLDQIDSGVPALELTLKDLREVSVDGVRFLNPNQIMQQIQRFKNVPMGPRRITLAREELLKKVQTRMKNLAHRAEYQDMLATLSVQEQLDIFGETVNPQTEEEEYRLALTYVRHLFADAVRQVEDDAWLKIDRIGMRLTGAKGLTPITWLYTKMALCGTSEPDVRYVMVDEVQDYTAAQLAVLAKFYPRAHFLMLGDENQAIQDGRATFADVEELFARVRPQVETCQLLTSYRSTPEVTRLFEKLAKVSGEVKVASVLRSGAEPGICICEDAGAYERELLSALEEAKAAGDSGLAALIARDGGELKHLSKLLGGAMPPVLHDSGSLPERGLFALTLKLAKGLEFDHVIIPDASEVAFPADDLSRRRLYTTISRATKDVRIISQGALTKLLD
ncbi:MAG: UvrD-helicase domain-containing protein [Eggerthellaceae bacterium]|nr:UvrD-helicase domain-containing protein [Eggerthellaceae bacterium]